MPWNQVAIIRPSSCQRVPDEMKSGLSATPELKDQTAIDMVKAQLAGLEKFIRMVKGK